jgi:hypothetical protein
MDNMNSGPLPCSPALAGVTVLVGGRDLPFREVFAFP